MKGLHLSTDANRRSNRIFISYRRGDADGQAHALRDRLARDYGRDNVFMDVDSIVPGTDFARVIEDELASAGVMLVLIGTNWRGERGGHDRLSDPGDFIRLEVAAALHRGIPAIPVLIETASLPAWHELPETLRPLLRIQAVSLRSTSWDYDISRAANAVARHIRPSRRTRRARPAVVAGVAAVVAIAALISLPRLVHPGTPHPTGSGTPSPSRSGASLTAATAVAAVPPDHLVGQLLATPFVGADVPSGIIPAFPALSDELTSLTDVSGSTTPKAPGLTATIVVPFSGSGNVTIYYLVFDNGYDANAYFAHDIPAPPGYTSAQPFSQAAIGDPTKCERAARLDGVTSWGCLTLSANVVSYTSAIQGGGARTESALAYAAVHHLRTTATVSPQTAFASPPGSLSPDSLSGQLQSVFPGRLVPSGLSRPQTTTVSLLSPPAGLQEGHYIKITFSGTGSDYSNGSYVNIDVFDNNQDAESHFNDPIFVNGSGHNVSQINDITQTNEVPSAPSGFAAPQQVRCITYAAPSGSAGPAEGGSACYVLWGDVVIAAGTQLNSTPADPLPQAADNGMAITLARSGVLFVGQALSG